VVGATGFEPATLCSQSRCATRLRHAPRLSVRVPVSPPLRKACSLSHMTAVRPGFSLVLQAHFRPLICRPDSPSLGASARSMPEATRRRFPRIERLP
jgi:hypothetical protein